MNTMPPMKGPPGPPANIPPAPLPPRPTLQEIIDLPGGPFIHGLQPKK